MIEIEFNDLGMPLFLCDHVKGYDKGKGKNICEKCKLKVIKRLHKYLFDKQEEKC